MIAFAVLLALLLVFSGVIVVEGAKSVTWYEKSFVIDDKRTFLIGGSMHYPRSSAVEWKPILQSMKDNGINILQTYVFWDLHEKEEGQYKFSSMADSEANEDLIAFLKVADSLGMYINLRFGPYICAEWNYGGIPVWMRKLTNTDGSRITFRTDNDIWMKKMLSFTDAALNAVEEAGLLAGQTDGPVVMLQIENEYGNIQEFYGTSGADYVAKLADYVASRTDVTVPWIMCQQGEGKGTAPPAQIINTCNGFYCDDWIKTHAADFPKQPHMFTENWPGWFQKWGEAVPHRPAVDVAYSVLRWFAKGGSFMNYYMAFGGTNFGRSVGGPSIVTSYDYDVATNEYGLRSEPKYSLLKQMHSAIYAIQQVVFETSHIPVGVLLNNSTTCESHSWKSGASCATFLSNSGNTECTFGTTKTVPAWSVSILSGTSGSGCETFDELEETFNSKKAISMSTMPSNKISATPIPTIINKMGKSLQEKIPSSGRLSTHFSHMTPVMYIVSNLPKEQLDVTQDKTDYLWYSTNVEVFGSDTNSSKDTANLSLREHDVLKFDVGTGAGAACRLWINGVEDKSGEKTIPPVEIQLYVTYRYEISLSRKRPNTIDILCTGAGLQNYGPFMEKVQTGIVNNPTFGDKALIGWKHSIGLLGEAIDYGGVSKISTIDPAKRAEVIDELEGHNKCTDLCWRQFTFTPSAFDFSAAYAFDLATLGKGAVWVNGHMLGRYSNTIARDIGLCDPACDENTYIGGYNDSQCRTGCGEISQRYYKIPTDWLNAGKNDVVLFEEVSGVQSISDGFKLVKITMENQ